MSFTSSKNTLAAVAGLAGVGVGLIAAHLLPCPSAATKKEGGRCPFSGAGKSVCPSKSGAQKKPMVVTVTGAAGQIGYAILFQIAAGRMLGCDQPIELRLLEITPALPLLNGVMMELEDCAFPLLTKIVATDDNKTAFEGCDVALLIGARPRGPGMTRGDLLKANANIFKVQGKALNDYANKTVKVLVVGNPANTNAKIAMEFAPDLPKTAWSAMTRLDETRAVNQLARKAGVLAGDIQNVIVWGNHSDTQYPDVTFATVKKNGKEVSALDSVSNDLAWVRGPFIQTVQSRGAAIIDAMKKSSAASAANAAVQHVRSWVLGTKPGQYVSMGVCSNGEYGVPKDLIFSFPCVCQNGQYTIVTGLESKLDEFAKEKLRVSADQLVKEDKDWRS